MDFLKETYTILSRLHIISRELNVPFDDGMVIREYSKRYGGIKGELQNAIIHPIYFSSEECIGNPIYDERGKLVSVIGKDGKIIYNKKTSSSSAISDKDSVSSKSSTSDV